MASGDSRELQADFKKAVRAYKKPAKSLRVLHCYYHYYYHYHYHYHY
jgi:hypothetical protein